MGVEGVLVALEAAAPEGGEVGAVADRHRLVLDGSGGVPEGYVYGDEPLASYGCRESVLLISGVNLMNILKKLIFLGHACGLEAKFKKRL